MVAEPEGGNGVPPGQETRGDETGKEAPESSGVDFRRLADDWMTIWQSEVNALAIDPEVLQAWRAAASFWTDVLTITRANPPAASGTPAPDHASWPARTTATTRAAPVAAAPDPRGDQVDDLQSRVAELERKLVQLKQRDRSHIASHPRGRRKRGP